MKQRHLRILDTLVDGPTNDLREIMFVLEQFWSLSLYVLDMNVWDLLF